jgi:hypothetical protein
MILVEELSNIELLRKLGEPYVNQIASLAQLKERPEGTTVFREGQGLAFYLLCPDGKS